MFLHRAMILQADSHDVSLVKNIIVALYVRRVAYRDLLPTDNETFAVALKLIALSNCEFPEELTNCPELYY